MLRGFRFTPMGGHAYGASSITSAIANFLRSPAIKTLALIGIRGFPAVTIIHCPKLTELVLRDMDQDNSTIVIDTLAAPQSPNPRSLCESPFLPPSLERISSRASESFLVSMFNTPNVAVVFENLQELFLPEVGICDFTGSTTMGLGGSVHREV